jgi:hypothetical protein
VDISEWLLEYAKYTDEHAGDFWVTFQKCVLITDLCMSTETGEQIYKPRSVRKHRITANLENDADVLASAVMSENF